MSILTANDIQFMSIVHPCLHRGVHAQTGLSFGLGQACYDISIKQGYILNKGDFVLASTVEKFRMPNNVVGIVHDKSSLVRKGLGVFNTVLDPGWRGYLTLELVYHGNEPLEIIAGQPIAQVIFHQTTHPILGYQGKYQDQEDRPVPSRRENSSLDR